jgi:hypothetical protein
MRQNYGGTSDDMASIGRAIVEAITEFRQAVNTIFGTVSSSGLFTMPAAATFVILDPRATAGSIVLLQAVNDSAALLQGGAQALYVDRVVTVAGTSFTVKTAGAGAAAGTEQFSYLLVNPLG